MCGEILFMIAEVLPEACALRRAGRCASQLVVEKLAPGLRPHGEWLVCNYIKVPPATIVVSTGAKIVFFPIFASFEGKRKLKMLMRGIKYNPFPLECVVIWEFAFLSFLFLLGCNGVH